jgi:MFS family permease
LAWGLYLKLSAVLLALLVALPLLAQFAQWPGAWVTSRLGPRRAAIWTLTLSRQVLWLLVILPILPVSSLSRERIFLVVAAFTSVFAVLGNNAWNSWMAELVPSRLRGVYFGRRTALCTVGTMAASVLAGLALDAGKARGFTPYALSGAALVASVAGTMTTFLFARQYEPIRSANEDALDRRALVGPFVDGSMRRVLIFQILSSCASGLSTVLIPLYLLGELRLSFVQVALYNGGLAAMRVLTTSRWGAAMDRVGARWVLVLCSLGMSVSSAVWLAPTTQQGAWPWIALNVLLAGLFASGQGLAAFALPLEAAPREGRPYYLAAFSAAAGVSSGLASSGGGWLLGHALPASTQLFGRALLPFHWLFVLATGLQLLGVLAALQLEDSRRDRLTLRPVLDPT